MEILLDMVIAFFAAFGAICTVWCILDRPIKPQPFKKSGKVTAVVLADGGFDEIGRSVYALRWLKKKGMKDLQILITDGGMDFETKMRAEKLAEESDDIIICSLFEPVGK